MEREPTLRLVADALARLHDLQFMRSHPLLDLPGLPAGLDPPGLRERLLSAIEKLHPPPAASPHSARWRQYHYLRLRYLEGASLTEVQDFIGVGERQARRDHRDALQAIIQMLPFPAPLATDFDETDGSDQAGGSALDDELDRIDVEAPPELTDLVAALHDALRLVTRLATTRDVTLDLADAAPEGLPVRAFVSRTMLRQLLLSMLSHLIEWCAPGTVRFRLSQIGHEVTLQASVAPAGSGVAGEELAPTLASRLATARRLTESQGGTLVINPAPGAGQCVVLRLPSSRPTLVLVIDDNPDVSRLFQRYLQGTGYRLVQARNGPVALDLARLLRPDVVTLDLMMPLQDGWDLLMQLQTDPNTTKIPVVACSVLPERDLALSLGVSGFLAKPFTRQTLLAALEPYRVAAEVHRGSP